MKTKLIFFIFSFLILVSLGFNLYFFNKTKEDNTGSVQTDKEIQKIIDEVGKLIILPQDEAPTVATVSDPEKLKNQPFFEKSQSGDKVLIYTKSAKAILWRPDTKQIVEVSPINIGQNQNTELQQ